LRLGFLVLPCCVFAGLPAYSATLSHGADDHTQPHHEARCAPQQNSLSIGSYGSKD
jgi:hypothetical protein